MGLNSERYKVVVVDDEAMAVKAICRIIEKYCPQFEVAGTAGNGSEALAVIRGTLPDLVLTDVEMPVMSGLEPGASGQRGDAEPVLWHYQRISGF